MTGFNSKRAMAIGRQTGTSDFNKTMQKFYDMQPPTKIIWHQLHLREGIYLYKGSLTDFYMSQKCNLKYTDLNLLIASRS